MKKKDKKKPIQKPKPPQGLLDEEYVRKLNDHGDGA